MSNITDLFKKSRVRIERRQSLGVLSGVAAAEVLESLELDATLSESMAHNAVVTEHPVEEGSNVADHMRVDPVRLTLTGLISNHAIVPTFINLNWTKVEDAYSQLRKWQSSAARLTVVASLETWDDLVIKSFSIQRAGPQTANVLPVSIEFQKIVTVSSRLSSAAVPKPKIKKAEPKQTQPKKPPQQRASVGKQLAAAITKALK